MTRLAWIIVCAATLASAGKLFAQEAEDSPSGPQKWALLIGVDDYAELEDLRFAAADQQALAAQLVACGFPEDQVFLLHDKATESRYLPNRPNIERQLELLLEAIEPGDWLLVSFSGHGVHLDGKSYLCTSEARLDKPLETMLPVEVLYERLETSKAGVKLLVVDACRNDPRPEGQRGAGPAPGLRDFAHSLLRPPAGIAQLTSCTEGQVSMEDEQLGHGVFMHYLLEGLSGKAAGEEKTVSLLALANYASRQTKKHSLRRWNVSQSPALKGEFEATVEFAVGTSAVLPDNVSESLLKALFTPDEAHAAQESWAKRLGRQVQEKNSIGMTMVLIPPGEFQMGSEEDAVSLLRRFPEASADEFAGEWPRHTVRITKPFCLSAHEVTLGQFLAFYHAAKYKLDAERNGKGGWGWPVGGGWEQRRSFVPWNWGFKDQTQSHPVVNVSWNDADAFCRWLSQKEGRKYRLPTEAEWEYACRAGTTSRFWFGNDPEDLVQFGNAADQSHLAIWKASVQSSMDKNVLRGHDGYGLTAPVGRFRPNPFGLHDMHGNVYEYCNDWYEPLYYQRLSSAGTAVDPQGPMNGAGHAVRGGSWLSYTARSCRAASRSEDQPAKLGFGLTGFRVLLECSRGTP